MQKYKFKVVKKRTRVSAVVNGNSKYARQYLPQTDVFAMPGTLGIFVFDYKTYAENWIVDRKNHLPEAENEELIVVRVIPIGRGMVPKVISYCTETRFLDNFYNHHSPNSIFDVISGTRCYKGVSVVD
jgi:hypothetical protein